MDIEKYLILSRSEWGDIFSNAKVRNSGYICVFIGYALCFINDGLDLVNGSLTVPSVYAIIILFILTILSLGIYFRNFFAIPLAVLGFDVVYIVINLYNTFFLNNPINEITICFSVIYFIINSLVFRLKEVFLLNCVTSLSILICATASVYYPAVAKNAPPQALMLNAAILSIAGLLLQQLVLTVRAILIEQLASIKLQVVALEAEMELEKARKEARERTLQLNRISAVEALGASIAHEINQPVAAALTYCHAVRKWSSREFVSAPETMKALLGVESNVERAARLIENIRMLTTRRDRQYAVTDLQQIVEGQVNLVHSEYERRGIRLLLEASPEPIVAVVCAPEIALAIINLLRNAMEAFDEPVTHGIVSVHFRCSDPDWVEIMVVDNGHGLSPEGIRTAFGAFQTTKEAGAGIGLSICQEVAEHHSGSITLESNPTGGLTAILRLATRLSFN